jgi:hypothetical protein
MNHVGEGGNKGKANVRIGVKKCGKEGGGGPLNIEH